MTHSSAIVGTSLIKIVASEQHLFDVQAVLAPFLDLVEISAVCIERIIGFLMGPIVGDRGGQLIVVPLFLAEVSRLRADSSAATIASGLLRRTSLRQ